VRGIAYISKLAAIPIVVDRYNSRNRGARKLRVCGILQHGLRQTVETMEVSSMIRNAMGVTDIMTMVSLKPVTFLYSSSPAVVVSILEPEGWFRIVVSSIPWRSFMSKALWLGGLLHDRDCFSIAFINW